MTGSQTIDTEVMLTEYSIHAVVGQDLELRTNIERVLGVLTQETVVVISTCKCFCDQKSSGISTDLCFLALWSLSFGFLVEVRSVCL